jgi:hypothetical protein
VEEGDGEHCNELVFIDTKGGVQNQSCECVALAEPMGDFCQLHALETIDGDTPTGLAIQLIGSLSLAVRHVQSARRQLCVSRSEDDVRLGVVRAC